MWKIVEAQLLGIYRYCHAGQGLSMIIPIPKLWILIHYYFRRIAQTG